MGQLESKVPWAHQDRLGHRDPRGHWAQLAHKVQLETRELRVRPVARELPEQLAHQAHLVQLALRANQVSQVNLEPLGQRVKLDHRDHSQGQLDSQVAKVRPELRVTVVTREAAAVPVPQAPQDPRVRPVL